MSVLEIFVVLFLLASLRRCSALQKQVFADVTTNKFTREHDGTWGLWSFHGVAQESHASQTSFIFNADLITGTEHHNIASMVYPALGLTSDLDPIYQEYLILQARVLGVDGFLVEWGYEGHASDQALQSYLQLAKVYSDFKITVNWCDHWLMSELKNKTEEEVITAFHDNLQYLMDTLFMDGSQITPLVDGHPLIFLFGGGITPTILKEVLSRPLKLPPSVGRPLLIGSYLNFASPATGRWEDWRGLISGVFGWAPYILRPAPPDLNAWDYYGDLSDVLAYQENVTSFGESCVRKGDCLLWCGSASPRFDNRGCAGWGRELRLIPDTDLQTHTRFTYDAQWDYYIQRNETSCMVLPTMNDFPEATPLLALNDSSHALYSTYKHIRRWKNMAADVDDTVYLPMEWFSLYKDVEFILLTPGLNGSFLYDFLHAATKEFRCRDYEKAAEFLRAGRSKLDSVVSGLQRRNITLTVPSDEIQPSTTPFMYNGSYIVNKTSGLYLTLNKDSTMTVSSSNYEGFIHFQFYSLNESTNYLKIFSPTKRKGGINNVIYHSRVRRSADTSLSIASSNVRGDFSELCSLVTNSSGHWHDATVELFRRNQAWDHSGPHGSDIHFESEGLYLVRNISLELHLIRLESAVDTT